MCIDRRLPFSVWRKREIEEKKKNDKSREETPTNRGRGDGPTCRGRTSYPGGRRGLTISIYYFACCFWRASAQAIPFLRTAGDPFSAGIARFVFIILRRRPGEYFTISNAYVQNNKTRKINTPRNRKRRDPDCVTGSGEVLLYVLQVHPRQIYLGRRRSVT